MCGFPVARMRATKGRRMRRPLSSIESP